MFAFSEYSCALDERLSGKSDGRQEELLAEEMRALYTQQTPKQSALYVLIEVAAAKAKFDGTFSAFIENVFYVGWSEVSFNRLQQHQGKFKDVRYISWPALLSILCYFVLLF